MFTFKKRPREACDQILLLPERELALMGDAILIDESNKKQKRFLITVGVATCIVVIIQHIPSNLYVLAHIAPDSDVIKAQNQLLNIFETRNIPLSQLDVLLMGGWKSHYASLFAGEEIKLFWQEKSSLIESLDITHLFFCDCMVMSPETLNTIFAESGNKFGVGTIKRHIREVIDEKNEGIVYSLGTDDPISLFIAEKTKEYFQQIKVLTPTEAEKFPVETIECIRDERDHSAEKRVCVSLLGFHKDSFPLIIFDTKQGQIFTPEGIAYVCPKLVQDEINEKFASRCKRDVNQLEIKINGLPFPPKVIVSENKAGMFSSRGTVVSDSVLEQCRPDPSSEIPTPDKAFRFAANNGKINLLKELIREYPTYLDIKDTSLEKGYTALRLAVDKKHYACVEFLLSCNASLEVKDAKGISVEEIILQSRDEQLLNILAQHKKTSAAIEELNETPTAPFSLRSS